MVSTDLGQLLLQDFHGNCQHVQLECTSQKQPVQLFCGHPMYIIKLFITEIFTCHIIQVTHQNILEQTYSTYKYIMTIAGMTCMSANKGIQFLYLLHFSEFKSHIFLKNNA